MESAKIKEQFDELFSSSPSFICNCFAEPVENGNTCKVIRRGFNAACEKEIRISCSIGELCEALKTSYKLSVGYYVDDTAKKFIYVEKS